VFGIATRFVRGPQPPADAPRSEAQGATKVFKAVAPEDEDARGATSNELQPSAVLTIDGRKHELGERRMVIGRSKDCDIKLEDPNVSRRHAEIRPEGEAYWVVDLDSTNGVEVKGKRVKRLKLDDGTRFTIGSTDVVFSRELV
jgi:pSer/pThr/pTyr-binding forkhead associated (FHA) protein